MALNKAGLKAAIIAAQKKSSKEDSSVAAQDTFASELSTAIDIFVKSGTVAVNTQAVGAGYNGFVVNSIGTGTGTVT